MNDAMTKPIREYIFRPMPEIWTDAGTGEVLADVLQKYAIIVDDRTQFARLYDYDANVCYHYRSSAGMIKLTIWKLGD